MDAVDVALDSAGDVYVSDLCNHRIHKFDNSGVFLAAYGTNGSGDGQFANLLGLTITGYDKLYVSEDGNSRIQPFQITRASLEAKFLPPLLPSSAAGTTKNLVKYGSVVRVKIEISDGISDYTDTTNPPTIRVVKVSCISDSPFEYRASSDKAGKPSRVSNTFRWSNDATGYWVYDLGTKVHGLTVGNCYRINASINVSTVTNNEWAVIQVTK